MKKIIYIILWYLIKIDLIFALSKDDPAWWIFWDQTGSLTVDEVKNWNIHIDDIPKVLRWTIDLLLEMSWTIAIIFIIIWAYKILFGSLTLEKSKWKDTIIMALTWFVIASLAWFIIKFLIDNLA